MNEAKQGRDCYEVAPVKTSYLSSTSKIMNHCSYTVKEDELLMLRLQNKARILKMDIEKDKRLIKSI